MWKKLLICVAVLFSLAAGALGFSMPVYAEEKTELTPIMAEDVKEGTYEIEVESSSNMFRVVKAELVVKDGKMEAVLTLSGTGYLQLFMGTGEEALKADAQEYIPYVEDAEGAYTYTVPVEALDKEIDCAAYSIKKEKWYDRTLVFLSSSLPDGTVAVENGGGSFNGIAVAIVIVLLLGIIVFGVSGHRKRILNK